MTDLYRMFDRAGRLLYVGISFNAGERATQHAESKPWWPQVDHIRIEHLTCDREDALRKERWTIYEEKPLHNIQHNHARHHLTPRGAVLKPYSAPERLWKLQEWSDLKKAMSAFVEALSTDRGKNFIYEEERRRIEDGATILDIDDLDAIGLIESMTLACRYSAPCPKCGDMIVPDFVTLERGGTFVSVDDRRCVSTPIQQVAAFGICQPCDTRTERQIINLKDEAA